MRYLLIFLLLAASAAAQQNNEASYKFLAHNVMDNMAALMTQLNEAQAQVTVLQAENAKLKDDAAKAAGKQQ